MLPHHRITARLTSENKKKNNADGIPAETEDRQRMIPDPSAGNVPSRQAILIRHGASFP